MEGADCLVIRIRCVDTSTSYGQRSSFHTASTLRFDTGHNLTSQLKSLIIGVPGRSSDDTTTYYRYRYLISGTQDTTEAPPGRGDVTCDEAGPDRVSETLKSGNCRVSAVHRKVFAAKLSDSDIYDSRPGEDAEAKAKDLENFKVCITGCASFRNGARHPSRGTSNATRAHASRYAHSTSRSSRASESVSKHQTKHSKKRRPPHGGGPGGTTCQEVGSDRISEKPKSGEFCGLAKRGKKCLGGVVWESEKKSAAQRPISIFFIDLGVWTSVQLPSWNRPEG